MKQVGQIRPHMERALFVVGRQNAGKSTLLRHMFIDPRLGTGGKIPTASKIRPVALSHERCLVVRCTSPHERNEPLDAFFKKLDRAMEIAYREYWRFNFACAMQLTTAGKVPDFVTLCEEFQERFEPERIRVIQIDPCQNGKPGVRLARTEIDQLRYHRIEMVVVDWDRSPTSNQDPNGYLLADFFDFA